MLCDDKIEKINHFKRKYQTPIMAQSKPTKSVDESSIIGDKPHIKIWPFKMAPEVLRELSPTGGDEEWLCIVPKDEDGDWDLFAGCYLDAKSMNVRVIDLAPHIPSLSNYRMVIAAG